MKILILKLLLFALLATGCAQTAKKPIISANAGSSSEPSSELAAVLGAGSISEVSRSNSDNAHKDNVYKADQAAHDLRISEIQAVRSKSYAAAESAKRDLQDSKRREDAILAALAKLASTKEDERGLVVTLSGSLLFGSNESVLLPSARTKLNNIGIALRTVSERNLLIEGHTDSNGTALHNKALSQRRADIVRDYLIYAGYPAGLILARGMGEDNPIWDNSSEEGRANNRRVEIIIERDTNISNQDKSITEESK